MTISGAGGGSDMIAAGRSGVISAGSWLVDHNLAIDHWPEEETLAEVRDHRPEGGGPGFNMSVDLARLGLPAPIYAMGVVGEDADGHFLARTVEAEGIDTRRLIFRAGAETSSTYVMSSTETGRRTFFHSQAVHGLMTPDDFVFEDLPARYFHVGLPGLHRTLDLPWAGEPSGWVAVLKAAGRAGLKRNLELAAVEETRLKAIVGPCLAHLDLLVVNDREIGALAGIRTVVDGRTDVAACWRALDAVLTLGAMEMAVAHFPRGALAVTRDGRHAAKGSVAIPPHAIVGTNGAGDAFAAGILYSLHEGHSLDRALALAHASAAASVRSITTVGSVERAASCLALADSWGWREDP